MPVSVCLWIAGSGEDAKFSPAPVIGWQSSTDGVLFPATATTYIIETVCTLNRAYLLHLVAFLREIPEASTVRILGDLDYVVDAFKRGWLDGWARDGFRKRPSANREEWRAIWDLIQSRNITVTAERPAKGSPDEITLGQLGGLASRKRRGISEPTLDDLALDENPWAKDDWEGRMQRAKDKDPWE